MMRFFDKSKTLWSSVLVVSVIITVFVVPAFPNSNSDKFLKVGFTLIFFSGVMSLEKWRWSVLGLSMTAFLLSWISEIFSLTILSEISRASNDLFFIVMVFYLIRQMALARVVTARVILESIAGYLLLGLIFSVLIGAIMVHDPAAFMMNTRDSGSSYSNSNLSIPLYFSFVTMATVGFGDIVPLKPYTRSLAVLISVFGQFYIAIIIAMLMGKFINKPKKEGIQ